MLIQNSGNITQSLPQDRVVSNRLPGGSTPVVDAVALPATSEPAVKQVQAAVQQPNPEQLKAAVAAINRSLRHANQNLQFSLDADTNKMVVKMVDSETGELIRQIPSDAVLAIARSIDQYQQSHQIQQGLLFQQKA
jgi:flagellar protein FlaG